MSEAINRPFDLNEKVYQRTVQLCHFFNVCACHRESDSWAPQVEKALANAVDFIDDVSREMEQGWELVTANEAGAFISQKTIKNLADDPEQRANDLFVREIFISGRTQDKLENIRDTFNLVSTRTAARVALSLYNDLQSNGLMGKSMFYQKSDTNDHKSFNQQEYLLVSP